MAVAATSGGEGRRLLSHRRFEAARRQMRAAGMFGWPEHGPHGDRNQGGSQDGPGHKSFAHQAKIRSSKM
ncbi:hypothetical protein AYJ54_07345 [Bradyrhizobium centrolobii]|uniref:Uncharacterized protein n=1 Tax=Bradyrhizobium centrolobii TaxID=1505087 RepID=A0A176YW38_9BRAD|nr:hypothetical protein AYJ54_07345 [Bradyrhizobium centrolobii]